MLRSTMSVENVEKSLFYLITPAVIDSNSICCLLHPILVLRRRIHCMSENLKSQR